MEQGKPLLTIGFAFTALGMLVFMLGLMVYPSNPMIAIGCAGSLVGLVMVGIASTMLTSGSSIAHREEEQIPVVYNVPSQMPQPVQPGEILVTQEVPEQPGQQG
ncbi:MAG: hypothetical protein CXX72_03030 [Methanobacteriota archaeon]|nr:MAG: hypothetical protein CXX72_03030 [Euryarchaeota archaeon]